MKITKEIIKEASRKTNSLTHEVISEIFHRLPFGQEITLSTGEVGYLKPLGDNPREQEGQIICTFDFVEKNQKWLIEFTLTKSGWEQSF
jgi:dolichyl-phosphate-mannose--protein O-mannosyl transferase